MVDILANGFLNSSDKRFQSNGEFFRIIPFFQNEAVSQYFGRLHDFR